MIYKNIDNKQREVTGVYFGEKVITAVYKGSRLVWQAIRSCFGNGFWINDKPWIDTDAWKN